MVPKPYPREFGEDIVRVARNRESGVTVAQVVSDFGVHPMTLQEWLRAVDVEDGAKPGLSSGAAAELRELKRRHRLLEQENWWCVFGKIRRSRKARPGQLAHEDLVRRAFTTYRPNRLWLTDITEHAMSEGTLYLRAIKDAWSNRLVGLLHRQQDDLPPRPRRVGIGRR